MNDKINEIVADLEIMKTVISCFKEQIESLNKACNIIHAKEKTTLGVITLYEIRDARDALIESAA